METGANYVYQKSDDALFQQAIKGLVSGLIAIPVILSVEEYRQSSLTYRGRFSFVDFNLNYDSLTCLWQIHDSKQGRIP